MYITILKNYHNLGYGFINFINPLHIILFYETYVNNKWLKYKSDKKIEINYAEKQNNANYHYKKKDNTYFFEGEEFYEAPMEIPKRFLSLYKSYYPSIQVRIQGDFFVIPKKDPNK